jgi:hypothetical protein
MRRHRPLSRCVVVALAISLPVLVISSAACDEFRPITEPGPFPWWIHSIDPATAPSDRETTVVIRGSNFKDGLTVLVDGTAARVTLVGSTIMNVVFPAHAVGAVDIAVTNGNITQTSAVVHGVFSYYDLAAAPLLVFTDPVSGLSTSEVHDAQEEIVTFNAIGDLLWSDGTRFPGFKFDGVDIEAARLCSCTFQIRFGSRNGHRRAYLTATYPHDGNPGTVLDLDRSGGGFVSYITNVPVSEPGPNTFSGVITEATAAGPVPLPGASVVFDVGDGWRATETDQDGRFEVRWLNDGIIGVTYRKLGYQSVFRDVPIVGNTRVDVQLAR